MNIVTRVHCCGRFTLVVVCLAMVSGCQLPDVQPFAGAVGAVHHGVDTSGAMFRESATLVLGDNDPTLKTLDSHWQKRRKATAALTDYADSLAEIVASGNAGTENAKGFATAVTNLLTQVGSSGLVGSTAFQIGGEIYGLVAQGIAYLALDKAVTKAGPAVARTCDILIKDLESMVNPVRATKEAALVALETQGNINDQKRLKVLEKKQDSYLDRMANDWDGEHDAVVPLLEEIEKPIAVLKTRLRGIDEKKSLVTKAFQAKETLIQQSIVALRNLTITHTKLADAIKTNRRINATSLTYAAIQIEETIARIRKIEGKTNE